MASSSQLPPRGGHGHVLAVHFKCAFQMLCSRRTNHVPLGPEGRQLRLGGNCRSFRRRSQPSLWASRSVAAIHTRHTDGLCPGGKPALCFLSHHGKNDIFSAWGGEEKKNRSCPFQLSVRDTILNITPAMHKHFT